ncbi:MAG: low-specificity L-threonine aldolase [Pirellulales bacterium]
MEIPSMGKVSLDYRSDTLTQPTPEMRQAMMAAEVGDDVFGEDPTVNRLQERVAELLGKEAALFVPSGTMSNQIAVQVHCSPGDEFLCEEGCHIYYYEQGAFAQLGGLVARTLPGEDGVLRPEQFLDSIRPDNVHCVRTRLVCLENTHNRGGGRIQPYEYVESICHWAHENNLVTHLDGARLFNAAVATGIDLADWAAHFHTVSVCFSKGLGAPVGSALVGSREFIQRAHRRRKCLGGGMRQAGIIAAGALYALDHHIERLAEDHQHAADLAAAIGEIAGLVPQQVDTNIVVFDVDPRLGTATQFVQHMRRFDLSMLEIGPTRVRAVTHLNLPSDGAGRAAKILRHVVAECTSMA